MIPPCWEVLGHVGACGGLVARGYGDAHGNGFTSVHVDLWECLPVSLCLCVHVAKLSACLNVIMPLCMRV